MKFVVIALIASAILMLVYVRLAPSDPLRWHVDPNVTDNEDMLGGVKRLVDGDAATLNRLDQIIRGTPRTDVLAGSVASDRITYVTRSRVVGFPDYATVALNDGQIKVYSRLRFGSSDLGVNKTRVEGWLQALRQGG
ncbi:MAG: DUF1499 domain-containing protein [Rhodobacteraceae bacterium]|nr:DUF1499 domain-containing protein [Paracoccaceae bacterium]